MIRKIVSGGQTGADRAALDIALSEGFECGGWVPKGRRAEDGPIPSIYPNLAETDSVESRVRTELNVRDSDATVVITHGKPIGGSAVTLEVADRLTKPFLHLDLNTISPDRAAKRLARWLNELKPQTLNVAGPRSSEDSNAYNATKAVLFGALRRTKEELSGSMGGSITGENEDPLRLEIARAALTEAAANFRHWDQMRWLAPYWFCVLATGAATVLGSQNVPSEVVRLAGLAVSVFGILWLVLIINLGRYHNAAIRDLESTLQALVRDPALRRALTLKLPFSLKGSGLFRTATLWFGIYIAIIVLAGLYTFFAGTWWSL